VQSGTLAKELETLHHVTATSGPDLSTNEWRQVENMRLPHHALDLGFLRSSRLQFTHDSFNILYPLPGRSSLSPCTKMVGGYCYCHLSSSIVPCVVVTMVVAIGRWSESWSRYWPEETWRTWRTWRLAVGRWKEEGRVWGLAQGSCAVSGLEEKLKRMSLGTGSVWAPGVSSRSKGVLSFRSQRGLHMIS